MFGSAEILVLVPGRSSAAAVPLGPSGLVAQRTLARSSYDRELDAVASEIKLLRPPALRVVLAIDPERRPESQVRPTVRTMRLQLRTGWRIGALSVPSHLWPGTNERSGAAEAAERAAAATLAQLKAQFAHVVTGRPLRVELFQSFAAVVLGGTATSVLRGEFTQQVVDHFDSRGLQTIPADELPGGTHKGLANSTLMRVAEGLGWVIPVAERGKRDSREFVRIGDRTQPILAEIARTGVAGRMDAEAESLMDTLLFNADPWCVPTVTVKSPVSLPGEGETAASMVSRDHAPASPPAAVSSDSQADVARPATPVVGES